MPHRPPRLSADQLPWPLPDRTDLRDDLYARYQGREGYHDETHLIEVLARIGELGGTDDAELVLAAWYHDAVYDGDRDDEERSAELALHELAGTGVDEAEVGRLVRMTAMHLPAADDRAGRILCDADLGILAADAERYRAYAAGVRADFAHVDDDGFRSGRRSVLTELLARPRLFSTAHAQAHWESAARANLTAELATLQAP